MFHIALLLALTWFAPKFGAPPALPLAMPEPVVEVELAPAPTQTAPAPIPAPRRAAARSSPSPAPAFTPAPPRTTQPRRALERPAPIQPLPRPARLPAPAPLASSPAAPSAPRSLARPTGGARPGGGPPVLAGPGRSPAPLPGEQVNGDVREFLRTTVGCSHQDYLNLNKAERDECDRQFGHEGTKVAARIDQINSATKRAAYDQARDTCDRLHHYATPLDNDSEHSAKAPGRWGVDSLGC